MNALTPINDKLISLIPRLGSDKDGEVVATARAITRQLAKTGADWHTLTALLSVPAPGPEPDGVTTYTEARDLDHHQRRRPSLRQGGRLHQKHGGQPQALGSPDAETGQVDR